MSSLEDSHVKPLTDRLGRYKLLTKLGEGGMGAVYLARDTRLDREVALKFLPPHSVHDADAVARFQREARALARLSHPGIVQAYDSDEADDRHFLVMEYVQGSSLGDLLGRGERPAPALAADYVYQAAQALQHAHERGLVHRDLKPSNLLLTPDRRIKLLDLGLARFLQDQAGEGGQTREGMGLGTPDYTAPEQFQNARTADARSDIYSLGCTLYHLVTGQVPFPGSSLSEKCKAHEEKEPRPVEALCPEVPAGLALAIRRMMAKRPQDRFSTARETAEALAPYIAGSSASFQVIRTTLTWDHAQLTVGPTRGRPWRRAWAIGAVLGFAGVAAILAASWPRLFPPQAQPDPQPGTLAEASAEAPILTVAKTGEASFRTIGDALEAVRPGQTIRVLDQGPYAETLLITRASKHQGITLEAARGTVLDIIGRGAVGITIQNVPGVAVRGFRIRPQGPCKGLLQVKGRCPGVLLERLELGGDASVPAVGLLQLNIADEEAPLVLRNCEIRQARFAVEVSGQNEDGTANRCSGIMIRDNRIVDCANFGVGVHGAIHRLQIVGNQILGSGLHAIGMESLVPPTTEILIANNTFFENYTSFTMRHDMQKEIENRGIQIRNNLILGSTRYDLVLADAEANSLSARGPGDGSLLHLFWRIDNNWREGKRPDGTQPWDCAWIPPSGKPDQDVLQDRIDVLSRAPGDINFLRPKTGSPLATQGAGREDPSLPAYIGALPPEGVEPWDWSRTWHSWPNKTRSDK